MFETRQNTASIVTAMADIADSARIETVGMSRQLTYAKHVHANFPLFATGGTTL